MTLTVHHLGISQSERIVWLCEELGLAYDLVRYDRDPVTRLAPDTYRALHPMGIAPVITEGDLVLAESGAIIEYILARHGNGALTVPTDSVNYADYLFWLHFGNGSLMPNAMALMAGAMGGPDNPILPLFAARDDRAMTMIEARLGEARYFAGDDLTAADIMMVFPLTTMRLFSPRDLASFPNLRAYLARIGERLAYRAAMSRGDPELTPLLT